MPILSTDARSEIDTSILDDPRVSQFWDGERVSGTYLAEQNLGGLGSSGIVWDAYFLFGPQATWDENPAPLLASGSPVVYEGEPLEKALSTYE